MKKIIYLENMELFPTLRALISLRGNNYMSREERKGHRKTRNERTIRIPELGYYLIVTDAEGTEPSYFTGLYNSMTDEIKRKLVIKVTETKTGSLVQKCLELINENAQYRIPWIVFDRDQVQNFDKIIEKAEENGINVGWSNPCFEIWMMAYFGTMPAIPNSWTCIDRFKERFERVTGQKYEKNDNSIFQKLNEYGDFEKAYRLAEQNLIRAMQDGKSPSESYPVCTIHHLVREIDEKVKQIKH